MMAAPEIQLTEQQRYWLEQVQTCEASGKTLAQYAADQGDAKALYAGKRSLVKKGILPRTRTAHFRRVQVTGATLGGEWRIQLPNGVTVIFAGSVDTPTLTRVLSTAAVLD
ncbi:MAG: hypothetical protein AB2536_19470 [Candidatus Thiodiazotropha endolucinida]